MEKDSIDKMSVEVSLGLKFEKEPDNSNVLNCEKCDLEVFNFWAYDPQSVLCEERKLYCLQCVKNNIESFKKHRDEIQFYFKFFNEDLDCLIERIEREIQNPTGNQLPVIEELTF